MSVGAAIEVKRWSLGVGGTDVPWRR